MKDGTEIKRTTSQTTNKIIRGGTIMNITVLVVRLTRDPELRYTQNETAEKNCNLVVNRPFTTEKTTNIKNTLHKKNKIIRGRTIMNITVLVGRLTRDPELRYTQNGTAVANFNLAVDRPFSKEKETDFINCVAWRKQAENLAQYMKKGSQIGISGRIQTRNYEKDGQRVHVTEGVADNIQFLDSRNSSEKSNSYQSSSPSQFSQEDFTKVESGLGQQIDDSDLPF